jgi:hypothetical protein
MTLSQTLAAALDAAQAIESELALEKTERAALAGQVTALTTQVAALVAEIAHAARYLDATGPSANACAAANPFWPSLPRSATVFVFDRHEGV